MHAFRTLAISAAALTLAACSHGPWGGMGHGPHYYGGDRAGWSARMDAHRQAMASLHEAMAKATTTEERQAVLSSHMALMGGMGPCPMGAPATR